MAGLNYILLADTPITELPAWIQRIVPMLEMNRSAVIYSQDKEKKYLGVAGEIKEKIRRNMGIRSEVGVFEIDIAPLQSLSSEMGSYREPSRFPSVSQDLCFAVGTDVPYDQLRRELSAALNGEAVTAEVEPLDIYQAEKEKGSKQITFRVTLQHSEKTLQSKDIQSLREKAVKKLSKKFKAKLI
jgi:phenylalanyl-tRNA synthetase beta chain